jgi:copper chaperone CopZ/sugar phosphate isomerase/epimerase
MGRLYPGLVSISFRKYGVKEIVGAAAKAGLKAVEWGGDVHVPPGDVRAAAETGRLTREAGLFVPSYGSYYRITGEAAAAGSVPDEFKKVCESALALEAGIVRVWGGTRSPDKYTPDEFGAICAEADMIGEYTGRNGLKVALECHNYTVTEDYGSALRFIDGTGNGNVYLYWQPNQFRPFGYNIDSARAMNPHVLSVHVFNWNASSRFPLRDGKKEWEAYLGILSREPWPSGVDSRGLMLEFMHDDRIETLPETAATLREWMSGLDTKRSDDPMTKIINIEGMKCVHCAARVKKALESLEGVAEAAPDLEKKECALTLEKDVDEAVLRSAVEELGFTVV